jgi:sugar-specific transcriptional regulator TrmB
MDIENILFTIGVSGTTQRVLLCLLENGPQPVSFLSKKLALPRPSIYDALHFLENKSLVISQQEDNKTIFSANDPNTIFQIIDDKTENLEKAKKEFNKILPELLNSPRITEPKIKMFVGVDGCRQTMRDILWYKSIETYTLWPMHKMITLLSPEFLEWHNKKRILNNISLKSIRKEVDKVDIKKYPFLGTREQDLRELRFLPKNIDLSMSYWIYDDNVAFVSSGKELYGFIVHSREFADMMKFQFNLIWKGI